MRFLLKTAVQTLYLFAPLLLAAALSATVLRWNLLPRWAVPIDGGRLFRGRRVFGDSKTWRGVLVAVVGCIAGVWLQKNAFATLAEEASLLPYRKIGVLGFGAAMGIAAMAGELPNSFVKRQLGIAPGATASGALSVLFYVWDQVDLLMFTWPVLMFWLRPSVWNVIGSVFLALVLHPMLSVVGYWLGARKTPR